jgi:ADP-ribosylglycohydrolase
VGDVANLEPDRARFRGALLGLAAGDALGTTLEFRPPGTFEPVDDMVGGGPFGLEPGQWTDDAAMSLCLAESLVESGGFDPHDQMERYVRWRSEGHLSSNGRCFDIGATVAAALRRFEETGDPYAGSTDPQTAGNGALMRLAAVPMFFAADARTAVERAADSSRTTHGAATSVDACRYMAGLIVGALAGAPKDELLAPRFSPVPGLWEERPLAPEVDEVAAGSFLRREPPEIKGRATSSARSRPRSGPSPRRELPGGGAARREPRRRRRHDRRGLRAARGRPLRRVGDPRGVEVEARAPRDDREPRRPAARRRPGVSPPGAISSRTVERNPHGCWRHRCPRRRPRPCGSPTRSPTARRGRVVPGRHPKQAPAASLG